MINIIYLESREKTEYSIVFEQKVYKTNVYKEFLEINKLKEYHDKSWGICVFTDEEVKHVIKKYAIPLMIKNLKY